MSDAPRESRIDGWRHLATWIEKMRDEMRQSPLARDTPELGLAVDEYWRRLGEYVQRIIDAPSDDERERVEREFVEFGKKYEFPRRPPEPWQFEAFALQLMARQGTFLTDFNSLYRRKAELDRRLLSDYPPEDDQP